MMDTTRRWGGCGPLWRRGLWAAGAAVVPWELRSWWHSWAASAVPRRYPQDTFYYIIGICCRCDLVPPRFTRRSRGKGSREEGLGVNSQVVHISAGVSECIVAGLAARRRQRCNYCPHYIPELYFSLEDCT